MTMPQRHVYQQILDSVLEQITTQGRGGFFMKPLPCDDEPQGRTCV